MIMSEDVHRTKPFDLIEQKMPKFSKKCQHRKKLTHEKHNYSHFRSVCR